MRNLIYIPDRHEESSNVAGYSELGQGVPEVRQLINENADKTWSHINRKIPELKVDFSRVKVFREGVTSDTLSGFNGIIDFLRSTDDFKDPEYLKLFLETPAEDFGLSQGERIGVYLGLRGASSEITEGGSYQSSVEAGEAYVKALMDLSDNPESPELIRRSDIASREFEELSAQRDRDIAVRINSQLEDGEIGILIIGQDHSVQDYLNEDIVFELIDPELKRILEEGDSKIREYLEGYENGRERG